MPDLLERIKSMLSALWEGRRTEFSEPPAKTLHVQTTYDKEREAEYEAWIQASYEDQMKAEMAEEENRKVVEPATNLPEGFAWSHWGDGSGGLYKDGKRYATYDAHPGYIEYKVLDGGWEISELRVSLEEVQDEIEKRVLNHLNIQQQGVETLGIKDAVSRPEPVQEGEQQDETLEQELRDGQTIPQESQNIECEAHSGSESEMDEELEL